MSVPAVAQRSLAMSPIVALAVVAAIFALSIGTICLALTDLQQRRRDLADSEVLLSQLKLRRTPQVASGTARSGSPFLEGPTVTVAGASLLQRVAGAIAQAGGTMQSSQVDVGGQGRDGVVGLLVSCEVEQQSMQKLLYDLEAGMPFLYVDQLDIQMPQSATTGETPASAGRLKVIMGVSGRWLQKQ